MSGQWEVVGKVKKSKSNGQSIKLSKSEKKKFVDNAPKAEDILPAMEVKTLYDNLVKPGKNKEAAKPVVVNSAKQAKETENSKNKANKKPVTASPEKKKVPRGMEEVLKALDVTDLTAMVEGGKVQFGQAPLIWLRSLAAALNTKLPPNPWSEHPSLTRSLLALCSSKLSKLLLSVARDIGPARQAFYENCLVAIANDLSKGSPVNGWLLLTEVLSQVAPELTVSNVPRWKSLMASYQNRANIGSALLWGLGQAGLRSLSNGIQVWEAIFLPAAELRSYTRVSLEALMQILTAALQRDESKDSRLSPTQYATLLSKLTILTGQGSVNKEVTALHAKVQDLANLSLSKSSMFLALLSNLNKIPVSHPIRTQTLQFLSQCLVADTYNVGVSWKEVYRANLLASATLLRHLHSQWGSLKNSISSSKFKDILVSLKVKNEEVSGVKGTHREGLMECQRLVEDLLGKVTKMGGDFPWKSANFLLILAISGLLAFDINKHGGFKNSSTGHFLRETGTLHYGNKALEVGQKYWQITYKWGEKELPSLWVAYGAPAWKIVVENSMWATQLLKVWVLNVSTLAAETSSIVANNIEQYAPGLLDKCQEFGSIVWSYTKEYSELAFNQAKSFGLQAIAWLNANVLVGSLSPENLSRVSQEAYNATQAFAIDTYQWIYGIVQPAVIKSS